VTQFITLIVMNLVTHKAAAKHELMSDKLASEHKNLTVAIQNNFYKKKQDLFALNFTKFKNKA
jgi:hypothetical protein